MAVTFVAATEASTYAAPVSVPGSSGNLLILVIPFYEDDGASSSISNDLAGGSWTQIASIGGRNAAQTKIAKIEAWWKYHAGANERSSYTPSISGSGGYALSSCLAFSGMASSSPVQSSPATATQDNGILVLGSQTVAENGSMSVVAVTGYSNGGATPASYTQRTEVGDANEADTFTRSVNAGSTGTVSVSVDSANDFLAGIHFVIKPGAAPSDLSGSSSVSTTTSGSIAGTGALAGSSNVAFTPSAQFASSGQLSGSISVGFSGSSALVASAALSGASSLSASGSGILQNAGGRKIFSAGNSISAGFKAGGFISSYGLAEANGLSDIRTGDTIVDANISGGTTQDLIDAFASDVEAEFSGSQTNVVILLEAINSAYFDGLTASQIYDLYVEYAGLVRAAGGLVFVCTPTKVDDGIQSTLTTFSNLLRASWNTFADGLIDCQSIPEFVSPGIIANPTYYSDDTHLADAGYEVLRGYVSQWLDAAWSSGTTSFGFTSSATGQALSAISGSSSFAASGSAAIAGRGSLTGSITVKASSSATMSAVGTLSGNAAVQAVPAGTIGGLGSLTTSVTVAFICEGELDALADGALVGSCSFALSASSALAGTGALVGTASTSTSCTGTLSNVAPSGDLSGTCSMSFTSSATATAPGRLSGMSNVYFLPSASFGADEDGRVPSRARLSIQPISLGFLAMTPMTAGDDRVLDLFVPLPGSTSTPRDLTGCTLWFRASRDGFVIEKTTNGGGIVLSDPSAGKATIRLDASDTEEIEHDTFLRVEVQLRTPSGKLETIVRGETVRVWKQRVTAA